MRPVVATYLTVALLGMLVTAVNAQVYQCKKNGKTTFQDTPCDDQVSGKRRNTTKADGPPCYLLTRRDGSTSRAEDCWTSKRRGRRVFYALIGGQ